MLRTRRGSDLILYGGADRRVARRVWGPGSLTPGYRSTFLFPTLNVLLVLTLDYPCSRCPTVHSDQEEPMETHVVPYIVGGKTVVKSCRTLRSTFRRRVSSFVECESLVERLQWEDVVPQRFLFYIGHRRPLKGSVLVKDLTRRDGRPGTLGHSQPPPLSVSTYSSRK